MTASMLVFDLDGTLVNSAPDLVDAMNAVFVRDGLAPLPFETARNFIGRGARTMIARGMEAVGGGTISPGALDAVYADFLAHYSAHIADRTRPFPGLCAALDRLAGQGHRFAVCTNKLEGLSVMLLEALGLAQRFAAICGQDTFGVPKPDPQMLLRTIAAAGGDPKRTVMIGDSGTDIRTARAAGVPVIAVDFGYTDQPVTELGPDRVISDFAELPAAVAGLCVTG